MLQLTLKDKNSYYLAYTACVRLRKPNIQKLFHALYPLASNKVYQHKESYRHIHKDAFNGFNQSEIMGNSSSSSSSFKLLRFSIDEGGRNKYKWDNSQTRGNRKGKVKQWQNPKTEEQLLSAASVIILNDNPLWPHCLSLSLSLFLPPPLSNFPEKSSWKIQTEWINKAERGRWKSHGRGGNSSIYLSENPDFFSLHVWWGREDADPLQIIPFRLFPCGTKGCRKVGHYYQRSDYYYLKKMFLFIIKKVEKKEEKEMGKGNRKKSAPVLFPLVFCINRVHVTALWK